MAQVNIRCCESRRSTYCCRHVHIEVIILDDYHYTITDHVPPRIEVARPDSQCPDCVESSQARSRPQPQTSGVPPLRPTDTPDVPDERLHQFEVQAIPPAKFNPRKRSLVIKNEPSQAKRGRSSSDEGETETREVQTTSSENAHWTASFESRVEVRQRQIEERRARSEREREERAERMREEKAWKSKKGKASVRSVPSSQGKDTHPRGPRKMDSDDSRKIVSDYSRRQKTKTAELLRQNTAQMQSSSEHGAFGGLDDEAGRSGPLCYDGDLQQIWPGLTGCLKAPVTPSATRPQPPRRSKTFEPACSFTSDISDNNVQALLMGANDPFRFDEAQAFDCGGFEKSFYTPYPLDCSSSVQDFAAIHGAILPNDTSLDGDGPTTRQNSFDYDGSQTNNLGISGESSSNQIDLGSRKISNISNGQDKTLAFGTGYQTPDVPGDAFACMPRLNSIPSHQEDLSLLASVQAPSFSGPRFKPNQTSANDRTFDSDTSSNATRIPCQSQHQLVEDDFARELSRPSEEAYSENIDVSSFHKDYRLQSDLSTCDTTTPARSAFQEPQAQAYSHTVRLESPQSLTHPGPVKCSAYSCSSVTIMDPLPIQRAVRAENGQAEMGISSHVADKADIAAPCGVADRDRTETPSRHAYGQSTILDAATRPDDHVPCAELDEISHQEYIDDAELARILMTENGRLDTLNAMVPENPDGGVIVAAELPSLVQDMTQEEHRSAETIAADGSSAKGQHDEDPYLERSTSLEPHSLGGGFFADATVHDARFTAVNPDYDFGGLDDCDLNAVDLTKFDVSHLWTKPQVGAYSVI